MNTKYEEEKEVEIDENKIYKMPDYIIKSYNKKYLVIVPDTGIWIVLNTDEELKIFDFLANGNSIKDALLKFDEEDVINVLVQIEAKGFIDLQTENIDNAETMQIYLTNACNLRCKHCYMYADNSFENELTYDEIIEVCKMFKLTGGKYVTLTGGEVSVRRDFPQLLRGINAVGLGIHILSNGVSWDDELIDLVAAIDVERVQISLDGFDEITNAEVRGKGCFEKALTTIDKLVKKNVNVYLAVTPLYDIILKNKKGYIEFAKNLVEKYKEYNFLINFSFELIEGRDISNTDIIKYNKQYMKIMGEICEAVYPGSELESFVINHKDRKIFNNCGYGRINISSTGDVYFCSRVTEIKKYGNIRKDSFDRIKEIMSRVRELADVTNLQPCKECELKYICGGGCRVDHFRELSQIEDIFDENAMCNIKARKCDQYNKEYLYQMMIDSNERLYG
ncbi:MAG: radical SAM protein [Lachnospiraceae bacterium]|nr:radical SAM protein [Lachnospiraceae bacterium]